MDDRKRSYGETLDYRIALRLFESAFEARERLHDYDQQLLLKEIAKRVSRMWVAQSEEQAEKAVKVLVSRSSSHRKRASARRISANIAKLAELLKC